MFFLKKNTYFFIFFENIDKIDKKSKKMKKNKISEILTRPKKTFTDQFIIPASGSLVHIINSSLNKRLQPKVFQKFSKSDLSIGQDELGQKTLWLRSRLETTRRFRSKLILDRIFLGLLYWEVNNFFFRDEFMMCTNDPEVGSKN